MTLLENRKKCLLPFVLPASCRLCILVCVASPSLFAVVHSSRFTCISFTSSTPGFKPQTLQSLIVPSTLCYRALWLSLVSLLPGMSHLALLFFVFVFSHLLSSPRPLEAWALFSLRSFSNTEHAPSWTILLENKPLLVFTKPEWSEFVSSVC